MSEPAQLLTPMQSIAREAGVLLMDHFRRHVKIEYKGDVDLVTIADRETEALVLARIRTQFPGHDVMGEEGTRISTGSDYKWYVDPLDGTTNFAHGFPVFCVSLAVEYRGERIAGVARTQAAKGGKAIGIIRLERVHCASMPGPNRLKMQLKAPMYLGERWELVFVREQLSVRTYAAAPLQPGEHYVEFPPEALWVF